MQLNHLNLCVTDVAACASIFSDHFGFAKEGGDTDYALLRGGDGFFLVLTRTSGDAFRAYPHSGGAPDAMPRTNVHVGFTVKTADAVRAKHAELAEAGRRPGPIKSFEALGASWTSFYCPIGDGLDLEVNASN